MLQKSYLGNNSKGRLRLGKYPYTYARVSVMRSFLLRKDDYHKLMKMDVNEIISYLESSQYRKEIDELAVQFKGVPLMEFALNRNLANTWEKLKRISPASLRVLISVYLLRVDVWNLKTIIRAKYTNLDPGQLPAMLLPSGYLNGKKLAKLAKKDSIEEILKSAGFIDYSRFAFAIEKFRETKSIAEIENVLDVFYYSAMAEFSGRLPAEGKLFRDFAELELVISALINILRLKRANVGAKDIERHVKLPHSDRAIFKRMLGSASAADAANILLQSRLKQVVEAGINEFLASGSLVRLELDLLAHALKRSILLIHQHPLTVDVILGYMFAKEIEVRNIKMMLKARQLGLSEEFVARQVITL